MSVEEPADWIKARHIKCGGREQTLAVVKAVANKKDAQVVHLTMDGGRAYIL